MTRVDTPIKIGVVGTGAIGQDHIKRIAEQIPGACVIGIADSDLARADMVAKKYQLEVFPDGESLIASPEVEAIIVASWDPSHAGYVRACIKSQKPVFCEKPLATSAEDCLAIISDELALGRKLVQVGFMRRYDPGYRELKAALDAEMIGSPLMVHCRHRNRVPGPQHTSEMNIKNSVIHEIDALRWLLNEEYRSAQVILPRRSRHAGQDLQDPQIVLLETESGTRIDVESFVSCQYGYDVQCEIVGEDGTLSLPDPAAIMTRKSGLRSFAIQQEWSERFVQAYFYEFQEWIASIRSGEILGPTAWDGYVSCVTADACNLARQQGGIVPITLIDRPSLY